MIRVVPVQRCELSLQPNRWLFAEQQAPKIERHWHRTCQDNPQFFNGVIMMVQGWSVAGGVMRAQLWESEFKNYIYWRQNGYPDRSVANAFVSAIIITADRAVVLGRQAAGHINSGVPFFPGGFIDPRDVSARGPIDASAATLREVREELGLPSGHLIAEPGQLITFESSSISIGTVYRTELTADELETAVNAHIDGQSNSELAEVVLVRNNSAERMERMPAFTRELLDWAFKAF